MKSRLLKRAASLSLRTKRILTLVLCLTIVLSLALPFSAFAQKAEPKNVRVGWYESAFHRTDPFGRRSGYGYEYQQRIATYTGWKYEYVEGSWSELLEKLIAGELDLLSDVLKMDIGFIRNIERNERDFHLVELILDIARYLKVPVIAEGVETEAQLRLLRDAGCDLVQGYYFSRPLPAAEFERKILRRE